SRRGCRDGPSVFLSVPEPRPRARSGRGEGSRTASPNRPRTVTGRRIRSSTAMWDTDMRMPPVVRPLPMPTLDARLLGPFEVRVDGEPVTVPGRNTRKVLVMLLDEANRPVRITGLVRGLWEDAELPDNPKKQIQNLVGEIRRAHPLLKARLKTAGEDAYRFDIAESELDILRCKAAERRSRALRESGDLEGTLARLRDALGEWRGPALGGMPGRLVESIARALEEDRLALLEQRFDLELE